MKIETRDSASRNANHNMGCFGNCGSIVANSGFACCDISFDHYRLQDPFQAVNDAIAQNPLDNIFIIDHLCIYDTGCGDLDFAVPAESNQRRAA